MTSSGNDAYHLHWYSCVLEHSVFKLVCHCLILKPQKSTEILTFVPWLLLSAKFTILIHIIHCYLQQGGPIWQSLLYSISPYRHPSCICNLFFPTLICIFFPHFVSTLFLVLFILHVDFWCCCMISVVHMGHMLISPYYHTPSIQLY
jgi:hypothetical protein